jgi:hypothetical protein
MEYFMGYLLPGSLCIAMLTILWNMERNGIIKIAWEGWKMFLRGE